MKSINTNKIYLRKRKHYLDAILKTIPTNTIINKFLPNTGATTMEIKAHRHSIIIEPNVPVIEGKEEKYTSDQGVLLVRGVYEEISMHDILEYLNSDVEFKKIITTPESYPKVRSAIQRSTFNLYKDFFILLDECERMIQDCIYRKKITLPFDDFFSYKYKAMISATPLLPSDPRFKKFKHLQVVPKFNYKTPLKLITTNSLVLSIRKYIDTHPDENYFFFMNSTDIIASIIQALTIKDEANIYCSKESVIKLKSNHFPNSYQRLPDNNQNSLPFKKYNFFTSRFFSAVDIELTFKPTVIMLTDTVHAFHSILDPMTESVQIPGRFRKGIKQIVHITTIDQFHIPKTIGEATCYLQGSENSYQDIQALYKAATNEGSKATLLQALQCVGYADYLNEDGSKNYFMWDNFINEERVKAYYTSKVNLFSSYKASKHFRMTFIDEEYPSIEVVLNRLEKQISPNLTCRNLCEALLDLEISSEKYTVDTMLYVYQQIERSFPKIYNAYIKLGFAKMQELEFNIFKIDKALYHIKTDDEKGNFQFLNLLELEFIVGCGYPSQIIVKVLRKIIEDLNLTLKPEITLLKEFFELSNRTTIERDKNHKDIKGYKILSRKFNSP